MLTSKTGNRPAQPEDRIPATITTGEVRMSCLIHVTRSPKAPDNEATRTAIDGKVPLMRVVKIMVRGTTPMRIMV